MLPIEELNVRHPGISAGWAVLLYEAASLCLSRHHSSPSAITVLQEKGGVSQELECCWKGPRSADLFAWRNKDEATEFGACAIGIASIEFLKNLFVVARMETGEGGDYYLSDVSNPVQDLESCVRLEISGIDMGNLGSMKSRLTIKLKQLERGIVDTRGIAAVIEFADLKVLVGEYSPP
jgi:hypothetical protein